MPFSPQVNDVLTIGGARYHVAEHPAAPGSGIPYGQEGRAGTVYQLVDDAGNYRALKVFKPRYRQPSLVRLSRELALWAGVPGLAVCRRQTLTPRDDEDLLRRHRDLTYAVIMPWIAGATWSECVQAHKPITPARSLALARRLAAVLTGMEEMGLAHCDLSGANLIIGGLDGEGAGPDVALVDVEQLYAPGLERPAVILSGSPGYAYAGAGEDNWGPAGDRFAGAVLLAEMLGWCDESVREAAWEAAYFAEADLRQPNERYRRLYDALQRQWGNEVAGLLAQVWGSESLADCPSFGEWLVTLPPEPPEEGGARTLNEWLALGGRLALADDEAGARGAYRQALALAEPGSDLAAELALMIDDMPPDSEGVVAELQMAPPAPAVEVGAGNEAGPRPPARQRFRPALIGLGVVVLLGLAALAVWFSQRTGTNVVTLPGGQSVERVMVPGGEFVLGSLNGNPDERPRVKVELDSFWLDKYEVTNAQFVGFLNDTGAIMGDGRLWYDLGGNGPIWLVDGAFQPRGHRDARPVTDVSWYGAGAYCEWAGGRLPTEAEWEKAARWDMDTDPPTSRHWPWGTDDPDCTRATSFDCFGSYPRPVGGRPDGASPYGAEDMAGNVWEWVQDAYRRNAYATLERPDGDPPVKNPVEDPDGSRMKVIRGGSYNSAETQIRGANRESKRDDTTAADIGFRCAYDR